MANNSNNRRRNNNSRRRHKNNNRNRDNYNSTQSGQNYTDNNQGYDDNGQGDDGSQSDNDQFDYSPSNGGSNNQYNSNNSSNSNSNINKNRKRGRGSVYPGHEDGSRATFHAGAGAKNKRRKTTAAASKGQPRVNGPPPASSPLFGESAIGSPAETAATTATVNSTCQHSMCIELAHRGLQHTHADARCFRFTNPKRFESVLRRRRRDGFGLSGEQNVRPAAVSSAHNPSLISALNAPHMTGQQGQRKAYVDEDDDLKISDYLYMKDSSPYNVVGSPHPTTWRYMFDDGEEEPSCANNDGPVTAILSGSTQTLPQTETLQKMSRSARQRARRAARKAEAKSNSNTTTNVGGNGSSLNSSKQQPQTLQRTHMGPGTTTPTRTCVIEGRGEMAWDKDSETDEWDRPLNVLEAMELLADMDRLNWESRQQSRTTKAPTLPMDIFEGPQRVGARLGTLSVSARPFLGLTDTDFSKRAVSVHTGTPPVPMHMQQQPTKKPAFVGGFRGTKPGDNRIAVPVKINNVVLTALLASGRIKSCIDRKVAQAIGLRTWSNPALEMIDHYRTPKTMHTCSAVNTNYGNKSGKVVLDVDDLDYYDFQIGIDLIRAFGLFPIGIKPALN
ncbi:hypothetical protein BGZ47_010409 [Haplosporangium gracile]|nr:hypothetical protein BGZ47_010409 [Haplosporangium gracile]